MEPTKEAPMLVQIGKYTSKVWKDDKGWWFQFHWMKEPEGPMTDASCTKFVPRDVLAKPERSRIGERVSGPGGGVQTERGFYSGD